MERWKGYFEEILNVVNNTLQDDTSMSQEIQIIPEQELNPPTFNEVCYITRNLRAGKAAGSDNIAPELIRHGGRTLNQRLHNIILKVWEDEKMPEKWKEAIICPIYKKGDRSKCENYRPISLLNVAYKIFSIILNNKLSELVEKQLDEIQSGFRSNKSTIDNIFMLRQILEKCHEYNIETHSIFVDYTKAFDSINRSCIPFCMKQYNIPEKLIRLVMLTLTENKARVRINNDFSDWFGVLTGVKQGDPLSGTLFNIVLDTIIKKLDVKGNISTRLKQVMAYADDILIISRTKQSLIETFQQLTTCSIPIGLQVNSKKTKYLLSSRKTQKTEDILVQNTQIEALQSFKYLGSIVNGSNEVEEEIKARIISGNKAYFMNASLFKSKLISKSAKLMLYKSIIRPVVTYGCETWVMKENIKQKLSVFERRILRRIFGPTRDGEYWRIKSNMELSLLIKHRNIINFIKSQRLSWFGHLNRMDGKNTVRRVMDWRPLGPRARGRPKKKWIDDVLGDLKNMKVDWRSKVMDRKKWKQVVEEAKTRLEL